MADNEKLRGALEVYLEQKRDKLDEVRQLDLIISRLRRDLGEAGQDAKADKEEDSRETDIGEARQGSEYGSVTADKNGMKVSVRPDEFFGMTYSAAAASYLEKARHAVSMDELLDALNRGGCPVGGREPRKTLYISLVRDVRTFVPISGSPGFLGLRKFYPNLKTLKGKEPKAKKKKTRKKKATRMGNVVKVGSEPKMTAPTAHPPSSAKTTSRPVAEPAEQKEEVKK